MKKLFLFSSLIALAAGAQAQTAPADASADDQAMSGEIIVTAQKREERLVDVPIAISAYSAARLEHLGATELTRVSAITPGFIVALQDRFAPGFAIRGVTSEEVSPQSEMRVAVFQDGVPVIKATAAYAEMFDVDRIEVEKGPQATLHGRSALNGAVSIYQKRATDDRSLEMEFGGGNYNYQHAQAVANLPVTDTLAVRIGGIIRRRDGSLKDALGSGAYNDLNASALRFAGKWEPSDDFTFNLIGTYDHDDTSGGVNFKSRTFLPLDPKTGAIIGDLDPGTATHLENFGGLPETYFRRNIVGVSGTADWRLTDQFSITSISGYRWFRSCESSDIDGTPTNILAFNQCLRGEQYSQESRLNFKDIGPLTGFIGGSVFSSKNGTDNDIGYDERAMALLLDGTLQSFAPRGLTNNEINALLGPRAATLKPFHLDRQRQTADIRTYDVFGDFTLALAEKFSLFAGGRITWDKKKITLQGLLPFGPSVLTGRGVLLQPTPGEAVLRGRNSSRTMTGRFGARYAVTPGINIYAGYGMSKLPQVVQLSVAGVRTVVPVEQLNSVEGGVKLSLMNGRLTADASVYHYDYKDFQTSGIIAGRVSTINAGEAKADGFEFQGSYQITPALSVFGSYGYNRARLKSGRYAGNFFRNSPDHKLAIGTEIEVPVGGLNLTVTPLYSWQSKMFFSDDNDRLDLQQRTPAAYSDRVVDEFQKGYGLFNLRAAITPPGRGWTLAIIGENLTNKTYVVDAGNTGDNFGIPTFIAGPRRTVRAELGFKF